MTTTTTNPAAAKIRAEFRDRLAAGSTIEQAAMETANAYASGMVPGGFFVMTPEAQADWLAARYIALQECAAAVIEAAEWIDGKAEALKG
jgi:hypothetical protein